MLVGHVSRIVENGIEMSFYSHSSDPTSVIIQKIREFSRLRAFTGVE